MLGIVVARVSSAIVGTSCFEIRILRSKVAEFDTFVIPPRQGACDAATLAYAGKWPVICNSGERDLPGTSQDSVYTI
jgi:hypothetical protein